MLHETVREVWAAVSARGTITLEERVAMCGWRSRTRSGSPSRSSTRSTTPPAPPRSTSHPLQRCFQDVHVLSQHLQGRLGHYTLIGRHWLGLGVDDDTSF